MKRLAKPPKGAFHHAKWHNWWVCRVCGALVEDWAVHDPCTAALMDDLFELVRHLAGRLGVDVGEIGGLDIEGTVAAGRAEGNAVVEASVWRESWRQVREVFRLRPLEGKAGHS